MKRQRRFRGLSKRQHEVFEQIAVNNDTGHHPATLAALERKGLIEDVGCTRKIVMGCRAFSYRRYAVPTAIHIEWCYWCK